MTILYVVVAVVVVFAIIVASRPSAFRITRSATISAPAPLVFNLVNDLHQFQEWSPWAKLDPGCKTTFEGPIAGTGAAFAWSGNNKVGAGRMSVTESRPPEFIRFKLEFLRPFKATNTTEFAFQPEGDRTAVTWSMSGKNNFMAKAFTMFMNCDKMIGGDFEKGLSQMASLAEAAAKTQRVTA